MATREIEAWITVNGARVPIFKGESKEDAVKNFAQRGKSKGKNLGVRGKDIYGKDRVASKKELKKELSDTEKQAENESNIYRYRQLKDNAKDIKSTLEGKSNPLVMTNMGKQIARDNDIKEKQIADNAKQTENIVDRYGNKVSTKGANEYAKSQGKTIKDLAAEVQNNPEAKKAANEMLLNGVDYDNATAIAHKQFVAGNQSKLSGTGNKISGMSKEEAMMNYKAIKISKHMPLSKQNELKALKAQYYKIWKG